MQELEITLDRVVKIWWLQMWRVGAVGLLYSVIQWLAERYVPTGAVYVQICGVIFMVGWNLKVTKMALQKRYEDFRIMLVPAESS